MWEVMMEKWIDEKTWCCADAVKNLCGEVKWWKVDFSNCELKRHYAEQCYCWENRKHPAMLIFLKHFATCVEAVCQF